MSKSTIAVCPKCGKQSTFTHKKEQLDNTVEHTFLECAQCRHKATIFYTDQATRAALDEQKALFDAGKRTEAKANAPKVQAMLDELTAKYADA